MKYYLYRTVQYIRVYIYVINFQISMHELSYASTKSCTIALHLFIKEMVATYGYNEANSTADWSYVDGK